MAEIHLHRLQNGILICHKQVNNSKIAHCGFVFNLGSRDEKENEQGRYIFDKYLRRNEENSRKYR